MPRNSAASVCAHSTGSFRPVLVCSSTTRPTIHAEAEVKLLRAELARVQLELRDLKWATNAFVRSII